MRDGRLRASLLVLAVAAGAGSAVAVSGCGGDHQTSSAPTATARTAPRPAPKKHGPARTVTSTKERLVRNPRRAAIERTVALFVVGVERSDSGRVCRLLGRPPGTLEGCAQATGIDLHAVPSSSELSVARIRVTGARASVRLAGGQTLTLRRAGHAWRITGLRP